MCVAVARWLAPSALRFAARSEKAQRIRYPIETAGVSTLEVAFCKIVGCTCARRSTPKELPFSVIRDKCAFTSPFPFSGSMVRAVVNNWQTAGLDRASQVASNY